MKKLILLSILFHGLSGQVNAQFYQQYFDGADTIFNPTIFNSSIRVVLEDDSTNIWQVGMPRKQLFNQASTLPNALITDTLQYYPPNNISRFYFNLYPGLNWGIWAIRWKQKLDIQKHLDGGKIEVSADSGNTWLNVFSSPFVYNIYGYQSDNLDTLLNGDIVFNGQDTIWRDLWLCFDMSWLSLSDSVVVRFTFQSDSVESGKEGWMIDNLLLGRTAIHTVGEDKRENYLSVYPNPANEILNIEAQKVQRFHIIEYMQLISASGEIMDEWKNIPTKFFIKTHTYPNGLYYLYIRTNLKTESIPVMIQHHE